MPSASVSPSPLAQPRTGPRHVVFVDPMDDSEPWWWPAMLVPEPEVDDSMPQVRNGLRVARFFADNSYMLVDPARTAPFRPEASPFADFANAAETRRPLILRFVRVGDSTASQWRLERPSSPGSPDTLDSPRGPMRPALNPFLQSRAVKRALHYLRTGAPPVGFRWRRWL